ncbi:MAG TPA: hypothetical protein VFN27_00340 [Xanthobacteraceae bacterium]|nr:hypothetical protein [Xanthobacteraceae bacterium]
MTRSRAKNEGHSERMAALIAAYREGLGLTAATIVASDRGARIISAAVGGEPLLEAGEAVHARWWCKSAQQAEWLIEAVARATRQTNDPSGLCRATANAAKRLGIILRSDAEVASEAVAVIVRLEQEIAAQQRAGGLKSVNRDYRDYRLQASARGEKVLRYADWKARYKAKLVRDIAHTLRSV